MARARTSSVPLLRATRNSPRPARSWSTSPSSSGNSRARGGCLTRPYPSFPTEGIVSKRLGSRYISGRSRDWLKFKNPNAPAVKRASLILLLRCRQYGGHEPLPKLRGLSRFLPAGSRWTTSVPTRIRSRSAISAGYLLVDRVGLRITVDANITTPGWIKYFIRRREGGHPLNNDAIKFLKCAVS
jgi:hypothetical protein